MIVNLADMKTYLGETTTDYDTFLTSQLNIVQSAIETYCRRKFDRTTYIQTFYLDEAEVAKQILLYAYPLVSVASITEDTVVLPNTEYRFNKPTGMILRPYSSFFLDKKETVVTYDAGYDYADMPPILQSAVYALVAERYNKFKSGVSLNFGTDVQRVSIPGTISIDFDYSLSNNDRSTPMGAILGSQLNIIDFYRSERILTTGSKLVYIV